MNIIVEMEYGSHLYGTETPESDRDIKGIFMPKTRDIILGKVPKSITNNTNTSTDKNTSEDSDSEHYSLHYFLQLALKGETCAIDMLNAPASAIIKSSDIWDSLVRSRHRFYSNNMKAFVGYARSQAAKYGVKGSRLKAAKDIMNILAYHKEWKRLAEIWEEFPKHAKHIHYKTGETAPGINVREIVVCGKVIQETVTVEYAKGILKYFIEKYGNRAKEAEQNLGIDWKALSHAVRIAYELKELYETGKITFPLTSAEYIIGIKKGNHEYIEVAQTLDILMAEIEWLSKGNPQNFPSKPDNKFWENWLYETVKEQIAG